MRSLIKQILKIKKVSAVSIAGLALLICALTINGPRPTCSLVKSVELTAQMFSVDDTAEDANDEDDTQASQNTANTYEEIHDEIAFNPHDIAKPYYSYFIPPSDQLMDGIPLAQLQRPPRNDA